MSHQRTLPSHRPHNYPHSPLFWGAWSLGGLLLVWWWRVIVQHSELLTAFVVVSVRGWTAQVLHRPAAVITWSHWWTTNRWSWLLHDPPLLWWTQAIDRTLVILIGLLVLQRWWRVAFRRPSQTFGSARWPTRHEVMALWDHPRWIHPSRLVLAAIALLAPRLRGGQRRRRPLWVARMERRMRFWKARRAVPQCGLPLGYYRGLRLRLPLAWLYEGTLIIGGSGSGKTLRLLMRAIIALMGRLSLVVADPKGELHQATAATLRRCMPVWIVDPRDPTARHFNPLAHVDSSEDAYRLAEIFIASSKGERKTTVWDEYAVNTLVMLILHLRTTEPEAPFCRLLDLAALLTYRDMKSLIARTPDPQVQALGKQWLETLGASAEAMGAVLSTLSTSLRHYRTSLVSDWTSSDDLPLRKVAQQPVALFLAIADYDQQALRPVVAFLYDRLFRVLVMEAVRQPGRRLAHGCICLLDEFANLGRVPEFANFLSQCRARRIAVIYDAPLCQGLRSFW